MWESCGFVLYHGHRWTRHTGPFEMREKISRKVGLKQASLLPGQPPLPATHAPWFFRLGWWKDLDGKNGMWDLHQHHWASDDRLIYFLGIGRFLLRFFSSHDRMYKVPCVGKEEADCFGSPVWNCCRSCAVETRKFHSHRLPEIAKVLQSSMRSPNGICSHCNATASSAQDNTSLNQGRWHQRNIKHASLKPRSSWNPDQGSLWDFPWNPVSSMADKNHFQRRTPGFCRQIQSVLVVTPSICICYGIASQRGPRFYTLCFQAFCNTTVNYLLFKLFDSADSFAHLFFVAVLEHYFRLGNSW